MAAVTIVEWMTERYNLTYKLGNWRLMECCLRRETPREWFMSDPPAGSKHEY